MINTAHQLTLLHGEQVKDNFRQLINCHGLKTRGLLFKEKKCLEENYVYCFATMPPLKTLQTFDSSVQVSPIFLAPWLTHCQWHKQQAFCGSISYYQIWCDDGIVKIIPAFSSNLSPNLWENIWNKGMDSMLYKKPVIAFILQQYSPYPRHLATYHTVPKIWEIYHCPFIHMRWKYFLKS